MRPPRRDSRQDADRARALVTVRALARVLTVAFTLALACSGTARAQARESLVKVDTVRVVAMTQTVPVIGRLVARRAGFVAARVDAAVERFEVDVGDTVEAGTVIASLDAEILDVDRELAESRLTEARSKLATARAEMALARQERERLERLKRTQATARAQLDDATQREQIAAAQVRETEAAIQSSRAQLRLAEINLTHAKVKAPYAGVVVRRLSEIGAFVKRGENLVELVGVGDLEVEIDVPSDRVSALRPGVTVSMRLDDGTTHRATVRAVIPSENRLTRTRATRLKAEFGETEKPLASEQSVTVDIPIGTASDALSVHKDAVTRKGGKNLVFVVEKNVAQLRPVELGDAIGERLVVLGGLTAGEQVVIRGNERLRPGAKVRIGTPGGAGAQPHKPGAPSEQSEGGTGKRREVDRGEKATRLERAARRQPA